jgi:alkaline phosphatase D
MSQRLLPTIIIESLVVIGLLFIPAGTGGWIAGWVFVALLCGVTLDDRRPSNPIVITGDLHCSWVFDLKAYFVGTSIASGLGEYYKEAYRGHLDQNPHVRFFDERNGGYVRCDVTQEEWRVDMKLADSISDLASPVPTFASFVVEDGMPGAEPT